MEDLHLAERFSEKALILSALFRSAVFSVLLVCFDILEEVIVGVIHGRTILASVPQMGGGGLEGKVIVGIMAFRALIPFFLFAELRRILGRDKLHEVIFQKRPRADAA